MSLRARIRSLLGPVLLTLCLVVGGEGVLRVCGYPRGVFEAFVSAGGDFYPPNSVIESGWGPITYEIRSNSLGLRGEEIDPSPSPSTLRILTIGDSITAGFFVDNEDTWQYRLQELLQAGRSGPVEVVNGARSGGSIDRALKKLRRCITLQPRMVILTFVTNDIFELGRSRISSRMMAEVLAEEGDGVGAVEIVLTKSALAEFVFDSYLKIRSRSLREAGNRSDRQESGARDVRGSGRYEIPGGSDFEENSRGFRERFGEIDGTVLGASFDDATLETIRYYRGLLHEVETVCRRADAHLLVLYFPAYPQIYDDDSSRLMNRTLAEACAEFDIEFLDLTDGFVETGRDRVLHLAPLDFHLNPAGNRRFAELVAQRLRGHEIMNGEAAENE